MYRRWQYFLTWGGDCHRLLGSGFIWFHFLWKLPCNGNQVTEETRIFVKCCEWNHSNPWHLLEKSCESVSFSLNCLCYFFPKAIKCLLLHSSVLSVPPCTSVVPWVRTSNPLLLMWAELFGSRVGEILLCTPLGWVSDWGKLTTAVAKTVIVNIKRFLQSFTWDTLISHWREGSLCLWRRLFLPADYLGSLVAILSTLYHIPSVPKAF